MLGSIILGSSVLGGSSLPLTLHVALRRRGRSNMSLFKRTFELATVGANGSAGGQITEGTLDGFLIGVAVHYAAGQPNTTRVQVLSVSPYGVTKPLLDVTGNTDIPLTPIMDVPIGESGSAIANWYVPPVCSGDLQVVVSGANADPTAVVVMLSLEA